MTPTQQLIAQLLTLADIPLVEGYEVRKAYADSGQAFCYESESEVYAKVLKVWLPETPEVEHVITPHGHTSEEFRKALDKRRGVEHG